MKRQLVITAVALIALAAICGAYAQTPKSTTVRKVVSLKSGEIVIKAVTLENTHSRSFTDPFSQQQCDLTQKAEGVIWRITCEGEGIAAKEVMVEDESGRQFTHTCWSRQGAISQIDAKGKPTGGGPQTEFLAVGPDDSKKVKITFGEASAEIVMAKAKTKTAIR
jgi:hypothetical protein